MSRSVSDPVLVNSATQDRQSGFARAWFRAVATAAIAIVVVGVVAPFTVEESPLWASDDNQVGPKAQPPPPSRQSVFAVESERTVQRLHEAIVRLANQALAIVDSADRLKADAVNQRTIVKTAEVNFENAKLAREIAEIDVVTYKSGTFLTDKATAEGEIQLAKSSLEGARQDVEKAKTRLSNIKEASRGGAGSLVNEYLFEDRLTAAELQQTSATFAVEHAETKLKLLMEYYRPLRIKELQSEVEKTRSNELGTKATWELAQAKLEKMDASARQAGLSPQERQILKLLDRAIPLEEQLRAKTEQLAPRGQADETLSKEIHDLTSELLALVKQAENEEAAAESARLRTRVHSAASDPGQPAKRGQGFTELRRKRHS